VKAPDINPLG